MDRTRCHHVGNDVWDAISGIVIYAETQLLGSRFRRLALAGVSNGATTGRRTLVGFIDARVIAVNRGGQSAEDVLARERDTASLVLLELRHTDINVGVLVGVIEVVCRIHVGTAGHFEARILFALAERVGVLELHERGRGLQGAHVPTGVEHTFFERSGGGPRAFDKADALRSSASDEVGSGTKELGVSVVSDSRSASLETLARTARHIDFDGYGLITDKILDAAKLGEQGTEFSREVFVIRIAFGDGDRRGGRVRDGFEQRSSGDECEEFFSGHASSF